MKFIKQFLISMTVTGIVLSVIGGCTDGNEVMGGSETDNGGGTRTALTIRATASSFQNPQQGGRRPDVLHTRATENGNITEFATDDAIGIFAIRNNAIVDEISNIKLMYSKAADGTGNWTSPNNITLYYYKDASYIAYYPYKEGITIDASETAEQIIASLAEHADLQPVSDQNDAAKYTACDLMIASGKATDDGTSIRKALTLNFTHQFTQLILIPKVRVLCKAPTDGGFTYRNGATGGILDNKTNSVTLNSVTACRMGDGSFRAIVKPASSTGTLKGSYKTQIGTDTKTVGYESASIGSFDAGCCYTVAVVTPFTDTSRGEVERALAPGDFVFHGTSGIEVYPGDGTLTGGKIPDYTSAVGIVVTCDPARLTDDECNYQNWKHAYVMGLEYTSANGLSWGPDKAEPAIPLTPYDSNAKNNMNGYTETKKMLEAHISDLSSYGAFNSINNYRNTHPVPDGINRSPWFIGSCGQWFDVMMNLCGRSPETFRDNTTVSWIDNSYGTGMWESINRQLSKTGKPLTFTSDYSTGVLILCSSQADDSNNWDARWRLSGAQVSLGVNGNKAYYNTARVRPFFAF